MTDSMPKLMYDEFPADPDLTNIVLRYPRLFRGALPYVWSNLPHGRHPLVAKLCDDLNALLPDADAAAFSVHQIKEKWGSLRFYWGFDGKEAMDIDLNYGERVARIQMAPNEPTDLFEKIRELVAEAEEASKAICDECGQPGEMRLLVRDSKMAPNGFFTIGKEPIPEGGTGWVSCRCGEHAQSTAGEG